ncbi:hypothetical protein P7C70_g7132, partial [Phenoliferia sp. Uapishka_3]
TTTHLLRAGLLLRILTRPSLLAFPLPSHLRASEKLRWTSRNECELKREGQNERLVRHAGSYSSYHIPTDLPLCITIAGQEGRVQSQRYDPYRDTRRKAFTTGVDTLVSRVRPLPLQNTSCPANSSFPEQTSREEDQRYHLSLHREVRSFDQPQQCAIQPTNIQPAPHSHEVFTSGDHPPPLVTAFHSQPMLYPNEPSEAELLVTHPPAPWAKFAVDCPTFTKTCAFKDLLTPVEDVYDRMHTMFQAIVGPGQVVEALGRKAATAAARKDRQGRKPPTKKEKEWGEAQADELDAARREAAQAALVAMATMLRQYGASDAVIQEAQEKYLADL